ncbi:CCHC-type domain-containing protein [Trichonephila inaurata madagascariensis]|uniref:CCHC-type domain-containing protein n=1 Tax=Trichonephila inaurata madagascariensis TaxID=2747483 RepID=A0A8X6YA10_9ARAC|nr:CCHC-type domain-containing protein [Trichonephila inaurata madagascariensis]
MGGIIMPEDQKILHLTKGVAEDLYQVLINSEVSTVDKFVTCCREVDAVRKKRVVPLRYERQPNVTPISTANEEDLSDLIRRIVKEEIEKVLPRIVTCINDGPSDLESIIREEVRRNLTPLTREKPAPSPYRTKRTGESSWRPRYCRDRRLVFSAARQRRQLDQYQRWDSDYGHDPESNYQRYKSNSPYPRRNPQRSQSISLSRRSTVRTSEEN